MHTLVQAARQGVLAMCHPDGTPATRCSPDVGPAALEALQTALREAGMARLQHAARFPPNTNESNACQRLQTAAAKLRAHLHAAVQMLTLERTVAEAEAAVATGDPAVAREVAKKVQVHMDMAVAARRQTGLTGSATLAALEAELEGGGGGGESVEPVVAAVSSVAASDAWDVEESCVEGLVVEGPRVIKKPTSAEHPAPEFATAFCKEGVRRAVFLIQQEGRSPIFVGLAAAGAPNNVGFSSSAMDGRCWCVMCACACVRG